jgi:TolA-binding protein
MLGYLRFSTLLLAVVAMAATAKPPQSMSAPQNSRAAQSSDPNLAAMQDDARRMHSILDQMRQNIAFVGNTTTPVNHQFQLQIDMWQVQLDGLDRNIAQLQGRK